MENDDLQTTKDLFAGAWITMGVMAEVVTRSPPGSRDEMIAALETAVSEFADTKPKACYPAQQVIEMLKGGIDYTLPRLWPPPDPDNG